jgi:Sulfatase
MEAGTKQSKRDWIHGAGDLLVAWFPALVWFVLVPFAVYLPNQAEFDYSLNCLIPFLIAALVSLFLFTAIWLVRPPLRTKVIMVFFYIGLYLALEDMAAPLRLGGLVSGPGHVIVSVITSREVLSLTLLVLVVLIGIKLPLARARKFAGPFVLMMVLVEAGYVWGHLSPKTVFPWSRRVNSPVAASKATAAGGNIYHVCFDALSGLAFMNTLAALGKESAFDGFTFFKNNRSNYIFTMESMPSYFSGTFFKGGSYQAWNKDRITSGLIEHLYDAGYTISMYVPWKKYLHRRVSHAMTGMDLVKERQGLPLHFSYLDFADLCLLRVAPVFLEEWVYDAKGRGIFRRMMGERLGIGITKGQCQGKRASDAPNCVPMVGKMLSDEVQRSDHGEYIYLHTLVTHSLWGTRNPNCRYMAAGDGTYFDHALCATNLMVAIITRLKQLGKYKDSTIIFQSDHGAERMSPQGDQCNEPVPSEIATEMTSITGFSPSLIRDRTFGFLLIKPAGESGEPLKVSSSPTQLADIPATIYKILGLPVKTDEGKPAFSLKENEEREIHMFAGFVKMTEDKKVVFAGKEIFEGNLCHFSYTRCKGWHLYPEIPWTWN